MNRQLQKGINIVRQKAKERGILSIIEINDIIYERLENLFNINNDNVNCDIPTIIYTLDVVVRHHEGQVG